MDSFGAKSTFTFEGEEYEIYKVSALKEHGYDIPKLPYSLRARPRRLG